MKASVIIPVYNAEKSIRRCVESLVFGQEQDIEIILIDDCSQDKSWTLCKLLAKEYKKVKCLKNSENRGVSYSRNQGLKIAKGKYILFVDSDDWVCGNYISVLVRLAESSPDRLILCGYTYINKENNSTQKFLIENDLKSIVELNILMLSEKILLKQLWNKIFLLEKIKTNQIFFDESQFIGEDFQFILDYIKATGFKKALMFNETLYYYVRENKSSLMSQLGWTQYQPGLKRLEEFCEICNKFGFNATNYYKSEKSNMQKNIIYSIVRSNKYTKKEKIKQINEIADNDVDYEYYYYKKLLLKECIGKIILKFRMIPKRIFEKMRREKINLLINKIRKQIKLNNLTILSQNCIGGVFYHDIGVQFDSPTINLFFEGSDFVKFAKNPKRYIEKELNMIWGKEYPIGRLGDIKIYFMHYSTCKEAKEAWDKRKERINYNKILILATDRNGFSKKTFEEWKKIKYSKVLFTVHKEFLQEPDTVYYPEYSSLESVPNLIPNREFYKDGILESVIERIEGKA